jgi:hypothetical protein
MRTQALTLTDHRQQDRTREKEKIERARKAGNRQERWEKS